MNTDLLLILLVVAVGYLAYKVHRVERLLTDGAAGRRKPVRSLGDGKVIPILKDQIEPGPFKAGEKQRPETPPENRE